jgi:hypothetical protein
MDALAVLAFSLANLALGLVMLQRCITARASEALATPRRAAPVVGVDSYSVEA